MRQTSRIISTYSADVFGVCSALFELGGMTVMHDASGCNSTYTTHDEPRWYDMDSMVYISGLSEMEAIMGDDEKLIGDVVVAAEELHPNFIALAGTPIPAMTGFDYEAVAALIEQRTGIPAFGFPTTGMNPYVHGVSMALEGLARRVADPDVRKTAEPSVNILGLTPLDFSVNGTDGAIARFLEDGGWKVLSRWAMGSTLEEMAGAGGAHVNLVVSSSGLAAAKVLRQKFGTPYVVGVPMGDRYQELLRQALRTAAQTGEDQFPRSAVADGEIMVVGECVTSLSLAAAIELETGRGVRVLSTTALGESLLREKDRAVTGEDEIAEALPQARVVVADPLFRPICPEGVRFAALPTEAFSGRLFRDQIPDLVSECSKFINEVIKL